MIFQEEMIATVSQVNAYVKSLISQDMNLHYMLVKGEISNFKNGANGHLYFSLKDQKSMISVVMFKEYASKLEFIPKDGDEVFILASLDVYEARGTYQLYAKQMEIRGKGNILVELEELKKKLAQEGLFDKNKRKINIYPKAIGVITARNSAAIKDILTNIKRRYPIADIYVFYSSVQGENAPKELIKAFKKSQEYDLDTLIIGRGGGASEDLSAFNDESLVRLVATSKMPVISAVGHEIDYTLLDYVSDVRVSTPTAAAEKATVDIREIEQNIDHNIMVMKDGIIHILDKMEKAVADYDEDIEYLIRNKISNYQLRLDAKIKELEALNPTAIIDRGYSISLDKDGKVIKSIKDINVNDEIVIILKDGTVESQVKKLKEK